MLTAKECREFAIYCTRFPIDDEANFHVPAAALQAAFLNTKRAEGTPAIQLKDCLTFYEDENAPQHIDEIIFGSEDW